MTGFAHVLPAPRSRCYSGGEGYVSKKLPYDSKIIAYSRLQGWGSRHPEYIFFLISSESFDLRIKELGLGLMEFAIRDGDNVTVSLTLMRITGFLEIAGKKG